VTPDRERFDLALARIDAANAEDPGRETDGGVAVPKELLYARRMTAWLERLAPDASEALRLAVRAQHVRRWTVPRERYPAGRKGYHEWRSTLARFHADTAAAILREVGYDEETVRRVQALIRKEGLGHDPETQLLEDAVCLVFVEHHLADFAAGRDEEQLIGILRKTWRKMSPRGRQIAVELELPAPARALLDRAVAGGPAD
jgi:hypothetical protein